MKIPFLPGLVFAAGLCFSPIQFCAAQEPPEVPAAPQPEPSVQVPGVNLSSAREPAPANTSPVVRAAPESVPSDPAADATQTAGAVPNRAPMIVPPPQPETVLPPPASQNDSFAPGVPNLRDLAMAVPEVEVWRAHGQIPQVPRRQHRRFELAYVVGKEPALVRLRFHPQAAGQAVVVHRGRE